MSDEIIRINSISELHAGMGFEKPKHPLISIINVKDLKPGAYKHGMKWSSSLYMISMKNSDCGMQYGRNHYDFQEGVLIFTAPNQVLSSDGETNFENDPGWMLFFHPDLIRTTSLGEKIEDYSFFSYDTHEALHLSEQEQRTMTDCVENIRNEYNERIDNHSQSVIVSSLELMLNYSRRFYERQFNTRASQNSDIVTQVGKHIKAYFNSDQVSEYGVPSIQFFSDKVNLSANYLSDLLKKETGRSAKDHINDYIVEKAKNLLLNSNDTVSEIAYSLGFNYPHYFSRLFKNKTGMAPLEYRDMN